MPYTRNYDFPRYYLTNNMRFRHTLVITPILIIACFCLLISCGQNESTKQENTKQQEPSLLQLNEINTPTLIESNTKRKPTQMDDGFYTADTTTNPIVKPAQTSSIEAPISPDHKDMVKDLGFSNITDSFKQSDKQAEALFCLKPDIINNINSVEKACKKMSDRLASVKYQQCMDAQLQITGCKSVNGIPILISKFAPLPKRKPLGKILVIGGTHGDELTSVSVTMRWIEQLRKNHSGLFHWHMTPLMNPDAVLKPGATRTNENGVDLNRNMPSDDWDEKALKYWNNKSAKNKRKFPGEKPASEPETQWLIDEINHFKPDAIISVHAPYGVVDFDSLSLNTAPKSLGKLHLNLLGTYPGSLGNYAGINRNIPVITLELPHSWEMPSVQDSDRIWKDIVSWLKLNVNPEVAKSD